MYKWTVLLLLFFINACSTSYYLMNEDEVLIDDENIRIQEVAQSSTEGDIITQRNVFVVEEGADFVTYQYKEVRVDEISPLATMYCVDVAKGKEAYLRNVSRFHNGYMRATFDCVNLAM